MKDDFKGLSSKKVGGKSAWDEIGIGEDVEAPGYFDCNKGTKYKTTKKYYYNLQAEPVEDKVQKQGDKQNGR